MSPYASRVFAAFAILIGALAIASCDRNASDASVASTKSQAEKIVAALTAYKQDKGRYPDKLDELVPKYLNAIEHPLLGDGWIYAAPPDGYRYNFGFRPGGGDTRSFYWSVEQRGWEMDDGKF
jgi:hypothetical protein